MPALTTIKTRRGTAAAWTAANPVLAAGEPGLETDTGKLKYGDGTTAWNSLAYWLGSAFANPMTTQDDIIVGGSSGAPTRLGKGSDGQVLTVDPTTHHLLWATPSAGFADPTTTKGDLIVHGTSTTRLGVGTDGQVLTSRAAATLGVDWETPTGGGGGSGPGGGVVLLASKTASSSATLDFTSVITSTYDEYIIEFIDVMPATNAAALWARVSTDNGSTWDSTSPHYYQNNIHAASATWANAGAGAGAFILAHDVINAGLLGVFGAVRISPSGTNQRWFVGQLSYLPSSTDRCVNLVNGDYENGAYNAIRFMFSAGNIASGTIRIYGVAKTSTGGAGGPLGARAHNVAAQSIANATWTPVTFDTNDWDTSGFHSTSVNPSRFTVPSGLAGKYVAIGFVGLAANSTNTRYVSLSKNGTRTLNYPFAYAGALTGNGSFYQDVMDLAAGDYVELQVYQDSGGALNTSGGFLSLVRLDGPAGAGSELDYAQFTATVNITATTEATANTIVTGNAVTYDGVTKIIIETFAPNVYGGTTYVQPWLFDGSSSIGALSIANAATGGQTHYARRELTPSAGSHTYSLRASVDAGTGHAVAGAGGSGVYVPGFIRITRV